MRTRQQFLSSLASLDLQHVERAIALLWYYSKSKDFEERTAPELADDLHDEGYARPNVTRLARDLRSSKYAVRGRRKGTFQLNRRCSHELDSVYAEHLDLVQVEVSSRVLPADWVQGKRGYLEQLFHQINGCYEFGFYDACAVLCRRLMESLIIEIYLHQGRQGEIKANNAYLMLDDLISKVRADPDVDLGRNSPTSMDRTKEIGDRAAHNRTYNTSQLDVDDLASAYRSLIRELLQLSGVIQ